MITNKWLMSHFEGNLRPVNKIRGSGHEQAEDESEYKEDLGAMASPAYAPLVRRRRLISVRAPVPNSLWWSTNKFKSSLSIPVYHFRLL